MENIAVIKFTDSALEELKKINTSENQNGELALRVGVKGGGCAGMSYVLGFDKKTEDDDSYIVNEIEVIINKSHGMYVMGMEIDYHNGLNNRGFVFNNPNASETCGCGTSFSV